MLLGFAIHRQLGILLGLFAAFILIGSVLLGWHYAVDGYVAIAMTWVIWRVVGWSLNQPFIRWLCGDPGEDDRMPRHR
jgi:hypothetical protein